MATKAVRRVNERMNGKGLSGERGLLTAVIAQALNDAVSAKDSEHVATARQYFAGAACPLPYASCLAWLDFEEDWLPKAFTNGQVQRTQNSVTQRRRGQAASGRLDSEAV